MRVLLLLSAVALLSALTVFVHSGVPAALDNRDVRSRIARQERDLQRDIEQGHPQPSEATLRQLQEQIASNQNRIGLLRQGLLPHDRTLAAFLTSPEGPLSGFSGDRAAIYLELANQTLAVAARASVPREQPFFEVKSSDEFMALTPAEQELLLQRTYLVYRVIDCFARAGVTDIRLLDIGAVASDSERPLDLEARRVTIVFAAAVEAAFAALATFFAQPPPPFTDLLSLRIERLDPSSLGLSASALEAPPVLLHWQMNWLFPAVQQ